MTSDHYTIEYLTVIDFEESMNHISSLCLGWFVIEIYCCNSASSTLSSGLSLNLHLLPKVDFWFYCHLWYYWQHPPFQYWVDFCPLSQACSYCWQLLDVLGIKYWQRSSSYFLQHYYRYFDHLLPELVPTSIYFMAGIFLNCE